MNIDLLKILINGRMDAYKDLIVEEVMGANDELVLTRYKAKLEAFSQVLDDINDCIIDDHCEVDI